MGKYHIFLSCEDDILIDAESLDEFLKKQLVDGCSDDIECIKKHDSLELSKDAIDDLKDSSIYVVNTHEDLDHITSWELGYAMGKGLKIIGYFDGKNEKKISSDVEGLIRPIPDGVELFVQKTNRLLNELKPAEYPLENDWEKQRKPAEKEMGATL